MFSFHYFNLKLYFSFKILVNFTAKYLDIWFTLWRFTNLCSLSLLENKLQIDHFMPNILSVSYYFMSSLSSLYLKFHFKLEIFVAETIFYLISRIQKALSSDSSLNYVQILAIICVQMASTNLKLNLYGFSPAMALAFLL